MLSVLITCFLLFQPGQYYCQKYDGSCILESRLNLESCCSDLSPTPFSFERIIEMLCRSKVRYLWSAIDEMFSTTREEQSSVESVLKGDVDQYVLDGTDRVLKLPKCLLERIEQLPHQVRIKMVIQLILF